MMNSEQLPQIDYDKYGRMRYHPEFHGKQSLPWTTTDQAFLIENYESLGPEAVSLALERTIQTVMTRAYELRKTGAMPKPTKRTIHRRSGCKVKSERLTGGNTQ